MSLIEDIILLMIYGRPRCPACGKKGLKYTGGIKGPRSLGGGRDFFICNYCDKDFFRDDDGNYAPLPDEWK
jgi:hypothetical protein